MRKNYFSVGRMLFALHSATVNNAIWNGSYMPAGLFVIARKMIAFFVTPPRSATGCNHVMPGHFVPSKIDKGLLPVFVKHFEYNDKNCHFNSTNNCHVRR